MINGKKALLVLSSIAILAFTVTACNSQDNIQSASQGTETTQQSTTTITQQSATTTQQSSTNQQAAEGQMFVSIISVTSPASPGGSPVTLFAKTEPNATCNISVGYKGGPDEAKSLIQKQAEANGLVSWTWTIDSAAVPGSYPITVTATDPSGKTASAQTTITIQTKCSK